MEPTGNDSVEHSLANAIWANKVGDGASSTRCLRSAQLLKCYTDRFAATSSRCDEDELRRTVVQLKSNPSAAKESIIASANHESAEAILECAVRLIFMTACQTQGTALGSYDVHEWKIDESLSSFLNRVYPEAFAGGIPEQSVSIGNLTAHTLSKNAGVNIAATDTLSDHLSLIKGEGFKTLLVFHHRAFLEHGLEVLKADNADLSHTKLEALSLGCLPPKFLLETLRTLDLVFPPFGDKQSQRILQKWVQRQDLDPDLLKPCLLSLDHSADQDIPEDLQDLYMQYPHWAPRLARLLKEVEDPTPTTRWERYAERRKSPRHMYKCALAAFIVAAIFGILATVLAAIQVWISYCAWVEDPKKSLCGAKKAPTPRL
ncbi:hypothetical protein HER10_EVM0000437 [Colletotrichum scovillei]|uniref:Uncharacterized protein n=1 Tax=Colletotrichum scovillei TaxID=1209932 RepID=A0A9P7R450_9PEZI|nr:uncharacterized protein HER10_EVM0000437 [Colletotrichum scovillei]KAF4773450.1 hypothetical protein HER10_EVM0000437 [Colletotrichum scovillei]KAG7048365.1 hypothetical protein JMJ77_0014004 [Colletotrichum scovillei]KAG7065529.1 hypothetical protein JMJ78_0012280 [Colletotrichum scovillei]KAG7068132.1 hypothetical protein JMJ76_0007824 [Colletotrichum scovillei]